MMGGGRRRPRPRFAEEWLVAVLDSLSESVVAIDGEGSLTAANPAAERLLDFEIDSRRYDHWTSLAWAGLRTPGGDPVDPHPIAHTLARSEPTPETVYELERAEGRWLELATHVLDPVAGAGSGVVVSCHEVTSRIRAEEERNRVVDVLRDFLAMTSHDLRTPIMAIRGYANLLREDHADRAPELGDGLAVIARQTDRLTRLVSGLSLMARLEAGGIEASAEVIDLSTLVRDAVQASLLADADLVLADGAHAVADPDHVHRIVANLLENARKYGRPPVSVRTEAAGGVARIAVADHGAGVPDGLVPEMFERFTRGTHRSVDGSGMGLAIVAGLVELNGGRVSYERGDPSGATFVVELPAAGRTPRHGATTMEEETT